MFILFPRFRIRVSVFALPVFMVMLWLEGLLPFAVVLISATAHELGHISALHFLGYRIRRIDILPMGAVIVVPEGISDCDEVKIALSGPIVSFLCAVFCSVWFIIDGSALSLFAVLINGVFAIINLMPVRKLDGGKALYCFLSYKQKKTAEQICSAVSICAKMIFIMFSAVSVVISDYNLGVILLSFALLMQIM